MSHVLNNAITVLGIPIQSKSIATIKLRDLIIVGINGIGDKTFLLEVMRLLWSLWFLSSVLVSDVGK